MKVPALFALKQFGTSKGCGIAKSLSKRIILMSQTNGHGEIPMAMLGLKVAIMGMASQDLYL